MLLVPKHEGEYAAVGTVARVTDRVRLPGGATAVALEGLHRLAGAAETDTRPPPRRGRGAAHSDRTDERIRELETEYRAVVEEILELRGDDGRIQAFLRSIGEPGALADTSGYSPDLSFDQKVELLETIDVAERLELALSFQRERLSLMQIRRRIREDVNAGMEKQQREFLLRKQMDSIRKELGEDDAPSSRSTGRRSRCGHARGVREQAEEGARPLRAHGRELARVADDPELPRLAARGAGQRAPTRCSTPFAPARSSTQTTPVSRTSRTGSSSTSPSRSSGKERGIEPDKRAGAILTSSGPPGTGKTSIGESIAKALNREFVRMSLGGVRDEAEIRGHRRTYIGALPGRLVRALRDAKTMNPVILLDEVDKVGADWRGDPSAALLEVLDPAQNSTFRDHYLDVEVDLSQVFFIATANIAETIPGPLLDRMEVIRFDGYTTDEKVAIARGYLWPRQRERAGLREDEVSIADDVLETVISEYTREARSASSSASSGRSSARRRRRSSPRTPRRPSPSTSRPCGTPSVAKFFREAAERTAVPGVATGLAVNATGGDVSSSRRPPCPARASC